MRGRLVLPITFLSLSLGVACSKPPEPETTKAAAKAPANSGSAVAPAPVAPAKPFRSIAERTKDFAVAELTADVSGLPPSEKKALDAIIEAAKQLDPLFDRQAWAKNPQLDVSLAADTSPDGKAKYAYFRIMRGPWDRQDHFSPFAVSTPKPPGAGFYPDGLSKEQFEEYVAEHPDQAQALKDLLTVVERDGEGLKAVPYHEAYAQWLKPAADKLREAAAATKNRSLRTFLESRAAAFESDDYYQSDKDWMDLDSRVEVTIGPYETYEDELLGLKASYEAFVTVTDPEASKKLMKFKKYLPKMEAHLPVDDAVKTKRGAESPIRVVDLVFSSGDARKSVQTIAFNLPNDERVRKEKGAKKVLLRNSIQTKFDKIMKPIGEIVMAPEFHEHLSGDAFFNEVLFHELSHSLGPAFVEKDGEKVEVRVALGSLYTALEECKADVMGAYNILFMIEEGEFPKAFREKLLVSYFAGLFRSVRFGVAEAHGQGAAVQINRYLETGAATFDATTATFSLDLDKLEKEIENLVRDLVMIQHRADADEAKAFLEKYGVESAPMKGGLQKASAIPVDLRPYYPVAGESAPR